MNRLEQLECEALARDCWESIDAFTRWCWPALHEDARIIWRWHHTLICALLQQIAAALDDVHQTKAATGVAHTDRVTKFALMGPPGIGKSLPVNRMFPAWRWGPHPYERTLFGSHGVDAQIAFQTDRRTIINSKEYRFLQFYGGADLPVWKTSTATKKDVETNRGGAWGLTSTTRTAGKGQGAHFDVHVIDDAHQPEDMSSPTTMAKVADIVGEKMAGRYRGPRVMIINAQCLGQGDIHDIIDARYPGDVVRVALPREYDPGRYDRQPSDPYYLPRVVDLGPAAPLLERVLLGDPHWKGYRAELEAAGLRLRLVGDVQHLEWEDPRTEAGELLDDPLYTEAKLKSDRAAVFFWATQQQQARVSRGDSIILDRWWDSAGLWSVMPDREPDQLVITCDSQTGASSKRVEPDQTAIWVQARWWDRVLVIERITDVMDTAEAARVLLMLSWRHPAAAMRIEDAGNGPAIYDLLRYRVRDIDLERPKGTTPQRLEAAAVRIEGGQVHLPAADAARPRWLPSTEPWPVRVFDNDEDLPETLQPKESRPRSLATKSPRDWVPEVRAILAKVKHGRKGDDDDADGLTIGLRYFEPHMPEDGETREAEEQPGNRYMPQASSRGARRRIRAPRRVR